MTNMPRCVGCKGARSRDPPSTRSGRTCSPKAWSGSIGRCGRRPCASPQAAEAIRRTRTATRSQQSHRRGMLARRPHLRLGGETAVLHPPSFSVPACGVRVAGVVRRGRLTSGSAIRSTCAPSSGLGRASGRPEGRCAHPCGRVSPRRAIHTSTAPRILQVLRTAGGDLESGSRARQPRAELTPGPAPAQRARSTRTPGGALLATRETCGIQARRRKPA